MAEVKRGEGYVYSIGSCRMVCKISPGEVR